MNIAIVGFDREGRASYEYYKNQGHKISIFDLNEKTNVPNDVEKVVLGDNYLDDISEYDLVLRTPGLHPQKLMDAGVDESKIWSCTNEFFKVCPTKNIIGVTGTKGKGTTSTLITKMLQNAGHKVHLGGNIGLPALNMLSQDIQPQDWVVLELSNFQLFDLQTSPHIAVCLLVVPEHLDWHKDEAEYFNAKKHIFLNQNNDDIAIYFNNSHTSTSIAESSKGVKIPYYSPPGAYVRDESIVIDDNLICKTSEIALLGEHNWQNVCAAVTAVWQVSKDTAAIKKAITEFTGLEYRLELIRELNGVKYFNDSFATTPEATIAAMRAFTQPKIMILGGSDKGIPLDSVVDEVINNNVKHVIAIGNTGKVIAEKLAQKGYKPITVGLDNMVDMVNTANKYAENGDVVLLSTASASFGLFKDYKDRGNQFNQSVNQL
jgi:UDP-N-acetylmuramoylalanine--D-glutamate ligase